MTYRAGERIATGPGDVTWVAYQDGGEIFGALYLRGSLVQELRHGKFGVLNGSAEGEELRQADLEAIAKCPLPDDVPVLPEVRALLDSQNEQFEVSWPRMARQAFHGLAGEFVDLVGPHSEADPAALLSSFLAAFGAHVGPGPHARADGAEHPARIWPLVVGDTAKARKGSSWAQTYQALRRIDGNFARDRVLAGFGSGEALIDAVAQDDRRLLVVESEYGRILSVQRRDGSTLSALLRQAWDGGRLQVRSRTSTAVADGAHVVVVAHITRAELLAKLAESDALGGSLNRFVLVPARRSKLLPGGGNLDDAELANFCRKVAFVAMQSRKTGILRRTSDADDLWTAIYGELAEDEPGGLLGAVIARDSAQMLRLSVAYALLDRSNRIDVPHIEAAQAVWNYSRAGAAMIFGTRTGNPVADLILAELQHRGNDGLDRTAIRDLFRRHARKEQIDAAIDLLTTKHLATKATKATHGRPRAVIRLATKAMEATKGPVTSTPVDVEVEVGDLTPEKLDEMLDHFGDDAMDGPEIDDALIASFDRLVDEFQ